MRPLNAFQIEQELKSGYPVGCRVRQCIRKSRNGAGADTIMRYGSVSGYRRGMLVVHWDGLKRDDLHQARHLERA